MELNAYLAGRNLQPRRHDSAARNEEFVGDCLKKIRAAPDAEEGLRQLLRFLGERLECERVYVFEEIDRLHIRNTYEWCREGVPSGIEQLPYIAKKDLHPWYGQLSGGSNIIEPKVERMRESDPFIYEILNPQCIRSIILSPLMAQGNMVGLLGADNPPSEKMEHISVLFDVLAYFVCSLVSQRELQKLREARDDARQKLKAGPSPRHTGKTILLVEDSRELLKCNERVLRLEGYDILSAVSLREAGNLLEKARPDAIILDIDLPDGNGITFCQELRHTSEIPVVFLTARSDEQTAREGIQAGGCAFLTKPYQLEDLLRAVAAAVRS